LRRIDRGLAHRRAALGRHAGRGRLLQHLLVAALHRAVALEQVDAVAVAVAEDLDLDVARALQVFLDQHVLVAEGRRASRLHEASASAKSSPSPRAHALAAAAGARP
jgi:hypothetical protein